MKNKIHIKIIAAFFTGLVLILAAQATQVSAATKIVFSRAYDYSNSNLEGIWIMNADGTNRVRITNVNGHQKPAVSTDGRKIAFYDGGGLSVMNADGTNRIQIYYNGSAVHDPTFSPDGTKILFVTTGNPYRQLFMINTDGSNSHQVNSGDVTVVGAAWSPDGTKIAYGGLTSQNYYQLFMINTDGSNKINLTNGTSSYENSPSFSPDGNTLVYICENSYICARSATAVGGFRTVLRSESSAYPNYSPDGSKIVYSTGGGGIFTINADGSSRTQLSISNAEQYPRFYTPAPSAVAAPADLQALFAGEGNARDSYGANVGTPQNGANFAIGKVGQAFGFDGVDDYVSVPDSDGLNITGDITIEGWIYPTGDTEQRIVSKFDGASITYILGLAAPSQDGSRGFVFYGTDANGNYFTLQSTTVAVQNNQWNHIAFTWNGSGLGFYVNGASQIASDVPVKNRIATTAPLIIGATIGTGNNIIGAFNGKIDELSLYSRALSSSEVQTVYEAGKLGKIKEKSFTAQTNVPLAAATIRFASAQSGTAQEYAIDGASLPSIPSGTPKLYYEVEASGGASANGASVCFDVSSLNADFANLRIYHLENGVWVARTASSNTAPNLCTSALSSFSPFAIAQVVAPTAAAVSVSGRVATTDGNGIRGALVTLTDANGASRTVLTGKGGFYRFAEIAAGQTVIISVRAKRFHFTQTSSVVDLTSDLEDVNFTAFESSGSNAPMLLP